MRDTPCDPMAGTRPQHPTPDHAGAKLGVAVLSLAVTLVLTGVKLGLGLLTGSLGLLADGLQGLIDVLVTGTTVLFVLLAARGACPRWTTGRERLEALAALLEALLLAIIAVCICYMALQKFLFDHHVARIEAWHLGVVLVAIGADYARALLLGRVAEATGSLALEANAAHFRTDSLGSLVVLAGIWLAHLGWPVADSIATLGLAALLGWTAWRIAWRAAQMLLDIADPAQSLAALEALATHPAVRDVPLLRLHRRSLGYAVVAEVALEPQSLARFAELREELGARLSAVLPDATLVLAPLPQAAADPPGDGG